MSALEFSPPRIHCRVFISSPAPPLAAFIFRLLLRPTHTPYPGSASLDSPTFFCLVVYAHRPTRPHGQSKTRPPSVFTVGLHHHHTLIDLTRIFLHFFLKKFIKFFKSVTHLSQFFFLGRVHAVSRWPVSGETVGVRQGPFHARYVRHRSHFGFDVLLLGLRTGLGTAGRRSAGGRPRRLAGLSAFVLLVFVDAQRRDIQFLLFVCNGHGGIANSAVNNSTRVLNVILHGPFA